MKHEVYLSLGSNIGDREDNLREAVKLISLTQLTTVCNVSQIYETKPVGYIEQDDFLNIAVHVETELSPDELLQQIQEIELRLKRRRLVRWGPRTIDIDMILYDDLKMDDPRLTLPHPRMFERAFVLVPLKDVYNGHRPGGINIDQLIQECGQNGVSLYGTW